MTLHTEDTIKVERIQPRPVQPALSQEERIARRSLLAICLVGLVGFVFGDFAWHVMVALFVVHALVR